MSETTKKPAASHDVLNRRNKLRNLRMAFTPSRPVQTQEIFAGRHNQLRDCLSILDNVGTHCILHGDRGVGKTSIANIVKIIAHEIEKFDENEPRTVALKIECTSSDTYVGLIKQIYSKVTLDVATEGVGFNASNTPKTNEKTLLDLTSESTSYNPKDVSRILKQIPYRLMIILDEFDRLATEFSISDFTETLKIISDIDADVHFMIVGVGDDVESLIKDHKSITRNLNQIHLNIMDSGEISEIINNGKKKVDLDFPKDLSNQIVDFSCGYPHYTHLLCLYAGENAIMRGGETISQPDLSFAISKAIAKADETLKRSYQSATMANRVNIYKEVLQACGRTPLDEYGTFQPKDVEKPLSAILKRTMKANQFGSHLINLCEPSRGSVLKLVGERLRGRYRFSDPLMRAYVKLNTATRR